jgi:hypothetical protein
LGLSSALSVFTIGSIEDLAQTWKEHLAIVFTGVSANLEAKSLLERFARFIHARFAKQVDLEAAIRWPEEMLKLTTLRDEEHTRLRMREPIDIEASAAIHEELGKMISDLQDQILLRKSMFAGIKRSVIDGVAKKIDLAMTVELTVTPRPIREEASALATKNQNIFAELEKGTAELRRELMSLRIVKCLGLLGTTRFFKKKLISAEADRKAAHASFWSEKLTYESQDTAMELQLKNTHQKLSDMEIEIEQCKQQREAEKANNSQLVFWKVKHFKQVDELKQRLDMFKGIGDVNIAELFEKLSDRDGQLDILRGDRESFEEQAEMHVRTPMKMIDQMRGRIFKTKRAKSALLT